MTAGSWLIASVYIDLTKQSSSATSARCGISSLTHAPDLPCWRNWKYRGRHRKAGLRGRHAGEPLAHADRIRQFSGGQFPQPRLVVEQVHLRRSAGLEEVDHALRARRQSAECRAARRPAPRRSRLRERGDAQPTGGLAEKVAAREVDEYARSFLCHRLVQVQNHARHRASRPPAPPDSPCRRRPSR